MDCQPALYQVTAHGVQMLIAERWIDIPDHTIQYRSLPGDNGKTFGGTGVALNSSTSTPVQRSMLPAAQSCRPRLRSQ
jgi:hypothetical protein